MTTTTLAIFILLLFAGDVVVLGKSVNDLQQSLDLLKQYCDKWDIEVNILKSKTMVFRKRGNTFENEKWYFDGKLLHTVDDFNYLGSCFNYNDSFTLNQELLAGKGLKAMNYLLYNLRKYPYNPKTCCQLFDSFINQVLSYAWEIWGFSKSKEIERIHLKFLKSILNVKTTTFSASVYGELGRYPLYIICRHARIIRYWIKIINTEKCIVKTIYNTMLNDAENGT